MASCTWSGPINGTRGFACVTCGARADQLGEIACPMKAVEFKNVPDVDPAAVEAVFVVHDEPPAKTRKAGKLTIGGGNDPR